MTAGCRLERARTHIRMSRACRALRRAQRGRRRGGGGMSSRRAAGRRIVTLETSPRWMMGMSTMRAMMQGMCCDPSLGCPARC